MLVLFGDARVSRLRLHEPRGLCHDRLFRRFGLSGKSFIPFLISSGCGVPGVMATATIENQKDRRMTAILTTMIPCGAKTSIIALVMGVLGRRDAWWVAPMFYFLGLAAIVVSALMLKTRMFAGEPAPFVMELPDYHLPALKSWWLHVERISAYLKKAATIIFAACVIVWFLSASASPVGEGGDGLRLPRLAARRARAALTIAARHRGRCHLVDSRRSAPTAAVATAASINALIAKENLVSTLARSSAWARPPWRLNRAGLRGHVFHRRRGAVVQGRDVRVRGVFNMLDAPCFAAIGTIRRQMDSPKWFWFAIGYQCVFAWAVGLVINQLWELFALGNFGVWTVVAFGAVAADRGSCARCRATSSLTRKSSPSRVACSGTGTFAHIGAPPVLLPAARPFSCVVGLAGLFPVCSVLFSGCSTYTTNETLPQKGAAWQKRSFSHGRQHLRRSRGRRSAAASPGS